MSSTADSWLSDAELLVPGLSRIVRAVWKSSLRIGAFRGASSRRRWWPEKSFRSSSACWVSRMRFCASWSCRESACIEIWRGKTGRQAYKQVKSAGVDKAMSQSIEYPYLAVSPFQHAVQRQISAIYRCCFPPERHTKQEHDQPEGQDDIGSLCDG